MIRFFFILFVFYNISAQDDAKRMTQEKFYAEKKLFILNELELEEDIEKKFWEIYLKFDSQRLILSREIALTNRKLLRNKIIEDFEIQELIKKSYENGSKSLQLKNNMMLELSKIIDNVNLVRLSSVELKFRQQMISRAKNNK
jgi:transcriptional regulator NrdR family protein